MELNFNRVGPGYFRTMGITVVQGRVFGDGSVSDAATAGRGEVVVNETFARRYWPGQDPLGRGIRFRGSTEPDRVIGVVQDGKYRGMREPGFPYMYRPIGSSYTSRVTLLARVDGDPLALLPAVRAEVRALIRRSRSTASAPSKTRSQAPCSASDWAQCSSGSLA